MTDLILILACAYIAYHLACIVRLVAGRARTPDAPRPPRSLADCVEVR